MERKILFGNHNLSIKTNYIARQADSSVLVNMNDTVVLVTVVGDKRNEAKRDFFPLTVNYIEKTYAAGKIPGGYFKREGKPAESEVLTSRLIDRPIRPLFPKNFCKEIQVVATVVSLNPDVPADIPALIGASAALSFAGLPFNGPLGAVRVGYKNGMFLLNPKKGELSTSELDLIVAGTKDSVIMVEAKSKELSEQTMLSAVMYGHEMMQGVIDLISDMAKELPKKTWHLQSVAVDEELKAALKNKYFNDLVKAYLIPTKMERYSQLDQLREKAQEEFFKAGDDEALKDKIEHTIVEIEKDLVRTNILNGEPRIDGRDTKSVREIFVETGLLPRVHGSSLFTRGETQALVATTLGTEKDVQMIDALDGERKERLMFHYNFPPYCVGEINPNFSLKRREIGHGNLARKAIEAILPDMKTFPYSIRVVSDITESNGSSSMASVCGASLSLMDAGVPIKSHVAGVAMGLIKEDDRFVVLTDILGDEDHLGDMDFKVAGTTKGVTALQMDIKVSGITKEIMETALEQAKAGRFHILDKMNTHIGQPKDMSIYAPRIYTMKIPQDKIKDVIGKGGATIRSLTDGNGVEIDINDSGQLSIASVNEEMAMNVKNRIKQIISDIEVGMEYEGTVVKIVDFGAFVAVLPNKEGLLHIAQIEHARDESVYDVLTEGQKIKVTVLDVDRTGRFKLTMRK